MRNILACSIFCSHVYSFPLALGGLVLLAACASAPDRQEWIRVGVTTKADVIARYGQPDLLIASPDGYTAVYRPTASGPSAPRPEIPTAQAGPFGTATTHMQPIEPGLGAKDLDRATKKRLLNEIRIRYDNRGIVQELSSP